MNKKLFTLPAIATLFLINCSISESFSKSSDSVSRSSNSLSASSDSISGSSKSSSRSSASSSGSSSEDSPNQTKKQPAKPNTNNDSDSDSSGGGGSSNSISNSSRGLSLSVFYSFVSSKQDDKTRKRAYRKDLQDLAGIYAMNLQNHKFFEADISRIAFRHGITNWESEEFTYLGIGEGLRKAELPEKELSRIASELSDGNKLIEKLIHQGYSNTEISFN